MTLLDAIAGLPDTASVTVTLTVAELRAALNARNPHRLLTTGQAAAEFGYSPDTWRGWADEGLIDGAFRDEPEVGTWRLPLGACEAHLERLRSGTLDRKRTRGPWKAPKASPTPARAVGAAADPEGKVVRLRPQTLGGRAPDDAQPGRGGLAGARRTDLRPGDRG